jgi:hypothetical protein
VRVQGNRRRWPEMAVDEPHPEVPGRLAPPVIDSPPPFSYDS